MIEAAEWDCPIEPDRTTTADAFSGKTGIALGFVGAAKGQRSRTFLPQSMSCEREAPPRIYGAPSGGR